MMNSRKHRLKSRTCHCVHSELSSRTCVSFCHPYDRWCWSLPKECHWSNPWRALSPAAGTSVTPEDIQPLSPEYILAVSQCLAPSTYSGRSISPATSVPHTLYLSRWSVHAKSSHSSREAWIMKSDECIWKAISQQNICVLYFYFPCIFRHSHISSSILRNCLI